MSPSAILTFVFQTVQAKSAKLYSSDKVTSVSGRCLNIATLAPRPQPFKNNQVTANIRPRAIDLRYGRIAVLIQPSPGNSDLHPTLWRQTSPPIQIDFLPETQVGHIPYFESRF